MNGKPDFLTGLLLQGEDVGFLLINFTIFSIEFSVVQNSTDIHYHRSDEQFVSATDVYRHICISTKRIYYFLAQLFQD